MAASVELLYMASLGRERKIEDLGKKKFQKLVYLVETLGHVDLGYTYQIHLYGPFSKALDDDLRGLSSANFISYGRSNRSYLLSVTSEGERELASAGKEGNASFDAIKGVFDEFCHRTPRELELLTTACFVCNKLGDSKTSDEVKECVLRIKGAKFKVSDIERSTNEAIELMAR